MNYFFTLAKVFFFSFFFFSGVLRFTHGHCGLEGVLMDALPLIKTKDNHRTSLWSNSLRRLD